MENSAACAAADILVLTVPFEGQAALSSNSNPRFAPAALLSMQRSALLQELAARLTHARRLARLRVAASCETCSKGVSVVAAFHNLSAELLNGDDAIDCDSSCAAIVLARVNSRRALAAKISGVRAIDGGKYGKRPHPRADHRAASA